MNLSQSITHLQSNPLFSGLKKSYLKDLACIAMPKTFKAGESIFHEGHEAEGFYSIVSGVVKVYKLAFGGKEQILHVFSVNDIFGEVPVFVGGNYPANADAMSDCSTLFFAKNAFISLVHKEPSLALNMLAVLSKRLRQFTHLVEILSLKEVPGRLSSWLLLMHNQNNDALEIDIGIAKSQLASMLGTIPETLSRIFAKMSASGFIAVKGRKIKLLNLQALHELASGQRQL